MHGDAAFCASVGLVAGRLNATGAVVVCPLAERFYGKRLLALYFVPGILGEIFAYQWAPSGAGSSLGIAGVTGGLFALTFLHRQEIPSGLRYLRFLALPVRSLCALVETPTVRRYL